MRISDWSSDVCSSDLVRESCAESLDCVFVAVVLRFSQVAPNRAHIARFVDNAGHNMICLSAVNCVGGNLADDFAEFDHGLARGLGHDAADRHAPGSIGNIGRSEEHTSELQSLMRISYAVFCLQKTNKNSRNK